MVTTACEVLGAARAAQGQKVNSKKRIEVTFRKGQSTFSAMTVTMIGTPSSTILWMNGFRRDETNPLSELSLEIPSYRLASSSASFLKLFNAYTSSLLS